MQSQSSRAIEARRSQAPVKPTHDSRTAAQRTPPTPAQRRKPRKPMVYAIVRRWAEQGMPSALERLALQENAIFAPDVNVGRFTDKMKVWLLLQELAYLDAEALRGEPGADLQYDVSDRLSRYSRILRGKPAPLTQEETAVLGKFEALRLPRVDSTTPPSPSEIKRGLLQLGAEYPAVMDSLIGSFDRGTESNAPTVPWARRKLVPRSRRLPRMPEGEKPAAKLRAEAFRNELGERFIQGSMEYRERRLRDWRRMALENPVP